MKDNTENKQPNCHNGHDNLVVGGAEFHPYVPTFRDELDAFFKMSQNQSAASEASDQDASASQEQS